MKTEYRYIDEGRQHLHTLRGLPLIGASTAKSIVGKGEALMQWYADMAAVDALARPVLDIKEEYSKAQALNDKIERATAKKELDKKYPDYAEARRAAIRYRDEAAESGTLRHGVLEGYIRECIEKNEGKPMGSEDKDIEVFVKWSMDMVKRFIFTEANCYHEGFWVGGIADLGIELLNGKRLVGDHKSSKNAFPDQFLQTAIYDLLLAHSGILDKDGNKLGEWQPADGFVIFPFRSKPFKPEFRWDVDKYRKGAEQVIELYKLLEL